MVGRSEKVEEDRDSLSQKKLEYHSSKASVGFKIWSHYRHSSGVRHIQSVSKETRVFGRYLCHRQVHMKLPLYERIHAAFLANVHELFKLCYIPYHIL